MKTISPAQLHQLLTAQPDLALLDVRTPVEYAEVHLPQASNVPLDSLAPKERRERSGGRLMQELEPP